MIPSPTLEFFLEDIFWAGLATLGFAVLFNVPRRLLPACVLCGAAGHVLRQILVVIFGTSLEAATFGGAILVGVMGELLARQQHAPAIIFQVAAAIPLVPGAFAYQGMLAIIRLPAVETSVIGPFAEAGVYIIRTGLILAAIGGGIAIPSQLFRRRKPTRD
ncbi:MAG: threonine/serine exporter family protein [Anaerolineae bacterium]|nr:threonine/serine exporter family protein [Anaerolineae bacterium]